MSALSKIQRGNLDRDTQGMLDELVDGVFVVHAKFLARHGQLSSSGVLLAAMATFAGRFAELAARAGLDEAQIERTLFENFAEGRMRAKGFMAAETRRRGH